jgi:hypothetical protein
VKWWGLIRFVLKHSLERLEVRTQFVDAPGNLSEVDSGSLDQGEDESGEEVDSTFVPMEVGFQGVFEFCMLVRRASKFLFAGGPNCFIWRAGQLSQTYVRYYAQIFITGGDSCVRNF